MAFSDDGPVRRTVRFVFATASLAAAGLFFILLDDAPVAGARMGPGKALFALRFSNPLLPVVFFGAWWLYELRVFRAPPKEAVDRMKDEAMARWAGSSNRRDGTTDG